MTIFLILYVYCAIIVLCTSYARDRCKYHWSVNLPVSLLAAVFWLPVLVVAVSYSVFKFVRGARRCLARCRSVLQRGRGRAGEGR